MKIAYLALGETWNSDMAGFSHAYSICRNLASLGNEVELFIRGHGIEPRLGKKFTVSFVNLPKISKLNLFAMNRELSKISSKLGKFDLIHERFSVNPLSIIARTKFKGPIILEVNDPGIETWYGMKRIFFKPFIKAKFASCDAIITQTQTLKGLLKKQTRKPIFVVSNGAEIKRVSKKEIEKARNEMNCRKNDLYVLFVGTFRDWHGVHLIPEIAEKFKENDNVKFVLIGKGELFEEVKEKSKKLKNVELLGSKPFERIPTFLKAADVLIAPFVWNKKKKGEKYGFWWSPLKLYEYLAAGKPIVSTGFKEIRAIVDGAGLLAEPDDLNDFNLKLGRLVKDGLLRNKLGKKGLLLAKKNSWKEKAKETIKVYERVLE